MQLQGSVRQLEDIVGKIQKNLVFVQEEHEDLKRNLVRV